MERQIPNLGVVSSNLAGHARPQGSSYFLKQIAINFISVFTILIIMKTLLTLFILLFSSSVVADDISDFEIEGISIGDSLLDYMSEEEIKKEIINNKGMYSALSKKFTEVYLFKDFKNYDYLSFIVKPNDIKYTIHNLRGLVYYDNEIEKCLVKLKEISEEISSLFINVKKDEGHYQSKKDSSGKSYNTYVNFELKSGDSVSIQCYQFGTEFKKKKNWKDNLSISIQTKEAYDWLASTP